MASARILDSEDFDDDFWVDDDGLYDDPPLYPAAKLAGMTLDELEREHERQCDRQGRLGDAEHINDRAVEETEARCRLVEAEIKRRKNGTEPSSPNPQTKVA